MVTIATHNGSKVSREHNLRNRKVTDKEAHINPNGKYEIWKDELLSVSYEKLFGEAVREYNSNQKREDRKITNYLKQIENDDKKHPVYEMIIGVYDTENKISREEKEQIYKEFISTWEKRNPNLYLCGVYYHADEQGGEHLHIDYIPIAHGYTRGMETQTGLVKALGEQGYIKKGKATAQIQWEQKENKYLDRLCEIRGIAVSHPKEEKREHVDKNTYIAEQKLKELQEQIKTLEEYQREMNKLLEISVKKPGFFSKNNVIEMDEETYHKFQEQINEAVEIKSKYLNAQNELEKKEKYINLLLKEKNADMKKIQSYRQSIDKAVINKAKQLLEETDKPVKDSRSDKMLEWMNDQIDVTTGSTYKSEYLQYEEWERKQEQERRLQEIERKYRLNISTDRERKSRGMDR